MRPEGATADLPEGPEDELLVTVEYDDWGGGIYALMGTYNEKPLYAKENSPEEIYIYFHVHAQRWTLGDSSGEVLYVPRGDSSSLNAPPLGAWKHKRKDKRGVHVSVVPQLLWAYRNVDDRHDRDRFAVADLYNSDGEIIDLEAMESETERERVDTERRERRKERPVFVRCEDFNGRPLFRRVGEAGTLSFDGRNWSFSHRPFCEIHHQSAALIPPLRKWWHEKEKDKDGGIVREDSFELSMFPVRFPAAPRFMWVQGAGEECFNGCYACTEEENGKPKYLPLGKDGPCIFFDGCWKLTEEGGETYYKNCETGDVPPQAGWSNEECVGKKPFPVLQPQRFYELPTDGASSVGALPHQTLSASASAPARAFPSAAASSSQAPKEEEAEGGLDEEWCEDVEKLKKYKCRSCSLVARDAVAHECGKPFCSMCWAKLQEKHSKCPDCGQDGSSTTAQFALRNEIRDLLMKCPQKCGEAISFGEKDWQLLRNMFVAKPRSVWHHRQYPNTQESRTLWQCTFFTFFQCYQVSKSQN